MNIVIPEGTAKSPAWRSLCTDCGISRTNDPGRCGRACQFINPDYPRLEKQVHGRPRSEKRNPDETFFGPFLSMHQAVLKNPREGAQWSGITTEIAATLLRNKRVDAVIAVAPDEADRWKPKPVIVTDADDLARCRGMRMGYAPSLSLMETAIAAGHRRIAFIGIPCQVYALRALEQEFGIERLYVIGTPCSDNTTTQNFHKFLNALSDKPESICYLEFRADYHVEIRHDDGTAREIPFLKLPLSKLPADFFPTTCQTCVDYTNALADITVGYMAGNGEQWIIVRNQRGQELLDGLEGQIKLEALKSSGRRRAHVKGFIKNVERAAGGLPLRSMPGFLRPVVAWLMPKIGPAGLEFARARLEMKAVETVLHLRHKHPARIKNMVPTHVWKMIEPYGIRKDS